MSLSTRAATRQLPAQLAFPGPLTLGPCVCARYGWCQPAAPPALTHVAPEHILELAVLHERVQAVDEGRAWRRVRRRARLHQLG